MSAKGILFVLLGLFALVYLAGWYSMARKRADAGASCTPAARSARSRPSSSP